MNCSKNCRAASYLIILLGSLAAFAAALVPFYHAAYLLQMTTLFAVLAPFVLYGLLVAILRGPWLLLSGLTLLAVSLAEVISERFLNYDAYADGSIFWVPVLAAAIVLPLAYVFGGGLSSAKQEVMH